jgi:hypothetical protein
VLVDLLGGAVLLQQASQNTNTADPVQLLREASVLRTASLTGALVTTLSFRLEMSTRTRSRVNLRWLSQNIAIFHELAHSLTCEQNTHENKAAHNIISKRCVVSWCRRDVFFGGGDFFFLCLRVYESWPLKRR